MKKILILLVAVFVSLTASAKKPVCTQWTPEQARAWWAETEWPVGCCYVPTYAVNQFEMWQEDTFNPEILDKEMALCESLGFNMVRIYLHEMLWFQDKDGFKKRINEMLDIAGKHGVRVTFTFCTNGGGPQKLGKQPEPEPLVHGAVHWCQSPHKDIFNNKERWPEFKEYLQDILKTFKNDKRIVYWCLYNEPENLKDGRNCLEFMTEMYKWAWEIRPSQPLTSPVWHRPGYRGATTKLDMISFVLTNSDIITFHCYYTPTELETFINMLSRFKRPMICQEYLARNFGSAFETCLPIMKREKVGALNWGLAEGKCEFRYPWGHKPTDGEPAVWFHSIFWQDYTPYSEVEVDILKKITADKEVAGKNPKYNIYK